MKIVLSLIAKVTRRFHPRGTERLLRLICNPDTTKGFDAVVPYDGDLRIHTNTASFIEWEVFFKGAYEPDVAAVIKRYLPAGGVFVDVGANIGVHSLVAAKIASEVIAVEPVPEIAERLRANCELNKLSNVHIVHCAASDTAGSVDFHLASGANRGIGSIRGSGPAIRVPVETLDGIIGDTHVDFIKIDAEGYDERVILGTRRVIQRDHPVVFFEYDGNYGGLDERILKDIFAGHACSRFGGSNVLCVPRSDGKQ